MCKFKPKLDILILIFPKCHRANSLYFALW